MLDELFMAQRSTLLRTLQRIVGNLSTAEDLLQETYLRVSAAVAEQPIDHLAPFMFQTARNLALDHLRGLRRQGRIVQADVSTYVIEQVPTPVATLQTTLENQQLLQALDDALAGLTRRQQETFVLNRLQGWSYAEIAAHFDVSLSTVQKDLKLALALCVAVHNRLDVP